jgi:hypothetical protein
MVLAAAPVQASDVDARIQVLERELVQFKQNQESALAAEMKGPKFSYKPAGGVTVAAADNSWSVNLRNRFQVYSTFYLTNDDDARGTGDGVIRIRRHRPRLILTSQQGFYKLDTQYTVGSTGGVSALNGEMYVNFGKTNPWLPNVGYGRSTSFSGSKAKGSGPENSILTDAANIGGQDRSIVLAWSGLPAMGSAKITHLNMAVGHDNNANSPYAKTPANSDSRTMSFGIGLQPLANIKPMGGLNVGSLAYSMGYTKRPDKAAGLTLKTTYLVTDINLAKSASVDGDHTYMEHGLSWKPVGFLSLGANYADYEGSGNGTSLNADEFLLNAKLQVWGPKSGLMGGGGAEGGISIAPTYSSADLDSASGSAEVTKSGVGIGYAAPGGWMTVTGYWDRYGCDGDCEDMSAAAGDDDKFNVFHIIVEYKF